MAKIMLHNARLAFPNIWTARPAQDGGKAKFGALFILEPKNGAVKELETAFVQVARDKWGDKAGAILKQLKAQDRLALHDGATKAQYTGFDGNLYVSASSEIRPTIIGRNREPLTPDGGRPYAGCYVVASIELWAQDSAQYGKRINAQLRGIQFLRDGDAFAAGTAASEDEFEDLGEQGDDTDPTA